MPGLRDSAAGRLDRRRRALAHALAVTGATTLVTGCAHSLAGGDAPPLLLLAAAFLATLVVLAPVLGARASVLRRLVAVAIAQAVQHGLFSLPTPAAVPGASGHGHHHDVTFAPAGATASVHDHGDMLLAHVAAGSIAFVLLLAGRRIVAALVAVVVGARLVRVPSAPVPLGCVRPTIVAARPARMRRSAPHVDVAALRGPPLLAV